MYSSAADDCLPSDYLHGLTVDRSTSSEVRIETAFLSSAPSCGNFRHARSRSSAASWTQEAWLKRSSTHSARAFDRAILRNPQPCTRVVDFIGKICDPGRNGDRADMTRPAAFRDTFDQTRSQQLEGGPCCSRMSLTRHRDVRSVQGHDSPASRTPCKYLEPSHGREHDAHEPASRSPPARSAAENLSTPKRWITASRRHAKGSAW